MLIFGSTFFTSPCMLFILKVEKNEDANLTPKTKSYLFKDNSDLILNKVLIQVSGTYDRCTHARLVRGLCIWCVALMKASGIHTFTLICFLK